MMRPLVSQPSLVEQVYDEVLSEIVTGGLPEGTRLIQDELARTLGVSRQPVQQALLLLRNQNFVRDAQGRGLEVAPIDTGYVRDLYEIRAVSEGLACRLAAERGAEQAARSGTKLIDEGRKAEREGSVVQLIAADVKFHEFLYDLSGNRMLKETAQPYWVHLRRLMGDMLMKDETPQRIWDQHEAILGAVIAGESEKAEELGRNHIKRAADVFIARLTKSRETGAGPRSKGEGAGAAP